MMAASRSLLWLSLIGLTALFVGRYQASASTYRVIHTFCEDTSGNCADGGAPQSGLVMDSDGNLYGMTHSGGSHRAGVIYELSPAGGGNWNYKILHDFCSLGGCADGTAPWSNLILDTAGDLFGTTSQGGKYKNGVVFVLKPNANRTKWTLRVLHPFCPTEDLTCPDGAYLIGGLTYMGANSGALYDGIAPLFGTTALGGVYGWGTVFQLSPPTTGKHWKLKTLYSFCTLASCPDGAVPNAGLIFDQSGNLFGTTSGSNNSGNSGGNVFELKPNVTKKKWVESVLYSFCSLESCADGAEPAAPVLLESSGNLLGVTDIGGTQNKGVAFNLVPSGAHWQENILYTFCLLPDCGDGSEPAVGAALVADTQGHLFGTTYWGGGNDGQQGGQGGGTLFELSNGYHRLYSFCALPNCTDGANPVGNLVVDSAGNIFGTTFVGGSVGPNLSGGTIFEFSP